MKKRILPLLLSLILCLSLLPVGFTAPAAGLDAAAPAAEKQETTEPAETSAAAEAPAAAPTEPDRTEKLSPTPPTGVSIVAQGNCGALDSQGNESDKVRWILYSDGLLKVIGYSDGRMADYPSNHPSYYSYRDQITSLYVDYDVTYIGRYAFYGLTNLEKADLYDYYNDYKLEEIGYGAFVECSDLMEVTVSGSVRTINNSVFSDCTGLTSLTFLGKAPDSIGSSAFSGTDNLNCYYYPVDSAWSDIAGNSYGGNGINWIKDDYVGDYVNWNLADGVLTLTPDSSGVETWNLSEGEWAPWYDCRDEITEVVIGNGITNVGSGLFFNLEQLKKVTIPDSVETIGARAFYYCSGLKELLLPARLTTVGESAFRNTGIKTLVFPSRLTFLGEYALANSSITSVIFTGHAPSQIGNRAFGSLNLKAYYPKSDSSWNDTVLNADYGQQIITWDYTKTGAVGKVELTGGVQPVTGAVPDVSGINLADPNCGVEIVSTEWHNGGSTASPARVFQGGNYPYLYVTLRAFDGCTVSSSTFITHTDFYKYGGGYKIINGSKVGTYYMYLNSLSRDLDYTLDLSSGGACTVTGTAMAKALLRDLASSSGVGTTSVSGTVTTFDFNKDGSTDLTMDNQSSGSSFKLVFTQQPGLLVMLAGSNIDNLSIYNSEGRQRLAIQDGVPFFQSVTIVPKGATLTLVGNGGRFLNGSTTLKLNLRGRGRINSWDVREYGMRDFRTFAFREGYLPLSVAATKTGADPVEIDMLSNTEFTQDTTLYVMWGKAVRLTINANGGLLVNRIQNGLMDMGSEWSIDVPAGYKLPTDYMDEAVVRSGYQVKGFSTDKAGTKPATVDESGCLTVDADTTYYIQWQRPSAPVILLETSPWYYSSTTQSDDMAEGEKLNLYCYAAGKGITYQWMYSSDGGATWKKNTLTGATTPRMSVPVTTARNGCLYHCVVTDSSGATVQSKDIQLRCYIGQYERLPDTFGALGNTVTFTAPVTGVTDYQWKYSPDKGTTWKNTTLTGAKTKTLSVPVTAGRDGYLYRCEYTYPDGETDSTNAAQLIVTDKFIDRVELDLSFLHDGITSTDMFVHLMEGLAGSHYAADFRGLSLVPLGMETVLDQLPTLEMANMLMDVDGIRQLVPGNYVMAIMIGGIEGEVSGNPYSYLSTPDPVLESKALPAPDLLSDLRAWETPAAAEKSDTKAIYGSSPVDRYQFSKNLKVVLNGKTMQEGVDYVRIASEFNSSEYLMLIYRFTVADESARIVVPPQDAAAPAGEEATFSVEAAGTALAYQWQYCTPGSTTWKNSTANGAKTPNLTMSVTAARDGQKYRCVVTDYKGGTATSKTAVLTVSAKPVITKSPKGVTAALDSTASFTVSAAGSAPWALDYQWQYRTSSTGTWKSTTLSGNKTATLRVKATAGRNGYQYRCKITDHQTEAVAYSSAATLKVKPAITSQPADAKLAVGKTAKFTVAAKGSGLTYQWQYKSPSATEWKNTTLTGNKTATLSVEVKTSRNNYQYRCKVTNDKGNSAYSSAATLKVKTTITAQPASVQLAAGKTAKFTVAATGAGLTYQWQYRTSSTGTWKSTTLTGNKTATLSVEAKTSRNKYQYRCKITDANGTNTYSSAATLTVK